MGMDVGGPSANRLYSNAGGEAVFPDVGQGTAGQLAAAQMAAQSHYAPPVEQPPITRDPALPADYNYEAPLPAKYSIPTPRKDYMVTKQALIDETTAERTAPITDEEINYIQTMKAQAELADFDTYVSTLVDPRKPGNLKWLMEVYPEFVNRRIRQVHTDYEYALRNQMIDSWGINTFDDLHFKYLVDQGKIKGPKMSKYVDDEGSKYTSGYFAPSRWTDLHTDMLRLPYASAEYGRKPVGGADTWTFRDLNRLFAQNQTPHARAAEFIGKTQATG